MTSDQWLTHGRWVMVVTRGLQNTAHVHWGRILQADALGVAMRDSQFQAQYGQVSDVFFPWSEVIEVVDRPPPFDWVGQRIWEDLETPLFP